MTVPTIAPPVRSVKPGKMPPDLRNQRRLRKFVLNRLREAEGIGYDKLCRETVAAVRQANRYYKSSQGVKAVQQVIGDRLAVIEQDETVWLTPAGWRAR